MSDPADPNRIPRAPALRAPASVRWSTDAPAAIPSSVPRSVEPRTSGVVPEQALAAQVRAAAQVQVGGRRAIPSAPPLASRVPTPTASTAPRTETTFFPREPRTWEEAGYDVAFAEALVLRILLEVGAATGRELSQRTALPVTLIREVTESLKQAKLLGYRTASALGDYQSELSEAGRARAVESRRLTTYVGPAPVPWEHYLRSVEVQALGHRHPTPDDLAEAFRGLKVSEDLLERLGPAVTSCRPMFLHGDPGNGKTSLAERMTRCFGDAIWIPHTLVVGGQLVKMFDAAVHEPVETTLAGERPDRRWIRVKRPTVIAGGELALQMLELQLDTHSNLCEPPLQLKANCGTLVIDDFGRGNVAPKDVLNRWIVPLEKRIDFLRLPDGRKVQVPFECLLVFSTNLEPRDLADEAFLRRIPYKIHVGDPSEDEFRELVEEMAGRLGVAVAPHSVRYLVDRHYKQRPRPFRFCHARDLLLQVKHLCAYEGRSASAGPQEWDRVAKNYFGLM